MNRWNREQGDNGSRFPRGSRRTAPTRIGMVKALGALLLMTGPLAADARAKDDTLTFMLSEEVSLKLKAIPSGSFTMGSPATEIGRSVAEIPHPVHISRFYIGIYELTQEQYQTVMKKNPSSYKSPDCPVTMITHQEALAFCQALNRLTEGKRPSGFVFSLPTEAQWEYACRAGTDSSLNNGKKLSSRDRPCDNLNEIAWNSFNMKQHEPQAVGRKKPNNWGLYDMLGNVWEMCLDGPRIYRDAAKQTDPVQPGDGRFYVVRGGSVGSSSGACRSAARGQLGATLRTPLHGFRVALIPEEMAQQEIDTFPRTFAKLIYPTYSVKLGSGVLKMNLVKLGRFHMGSPKGELGRKEDEIEHKVRISYDFYMGIYEVTRNQYHLVMGGGTGSDGDRKARKKNDFQGDGAVQVSWNEAMEFCKTLNRITEATRPLGYRFSLPTEAEWEYVCRGDVAHSTPSLPSGKPLNSLNPPCANLDRICHYDRNPKHPHPYWVVSCRSLPVGCYTKTRSGMFDMSGNAEEWVLDTYAPYPFDLASNIEQINPVHLGPGEKVLRGGGFHEDDLSFYRSASRKSANPQDRAGFRIVLTPIQWSAFSTDMSESKDLNWKRFRR